MFAIEKFKDFVDPILKPTYSYVQQHFSLANYNAIFKLLNSCCYNKLRNCEYNGPYMRFKKVVLNVIVKIFLLNLFGSHKVICFFECFSFHLKNNFFIMTSLEQERFQFR